jgi:hypothetical protein
MVMGTLLDEFLRIHESEREYLEVSPPASGYIKALEAFGWVIVPVIQVGRVVLNILRKTGLPNVVAVTPEHATELKFPLGSSGSRVLFRRHPYDAFRYIPTAEYNTYILKDKIAELARVMISAGATSFQITADDASTSELVFDAAAMANVKASRKGATKIVWSYTGGGLNTGTLPDGLYWFNHEKSWQTIWESAVHHGAESIRLEIAQEGNHELSGSLAAKFKGAGFKLGGDFHGTSSSRLKVEVRFSEK